MTIEEMELGADQAVSLLKAMANRHRLIILCCLQGGELSVGDVNQKIGLSQSALSQHLALLRRDNLVKTRKEAQTVYYSLSSAEVEAIIATLHRLYCAS